jgi:hypothetical protein
MSQLRSLPFSTTADQSGYAALVLMADRLGKTAINKVITHSIKTIHWVQPPNYLSLKMILSFHHFISLKI